MEKYISDKYLLNILRHLYRIAKVGKKYFKICKEALRRGLDWPQKAELIYYGYIKEPK